MWKKILLFVQVLVFAVFSASAQDQTVSGTITDESGAALPGVSVRVKGTNKGTSTNASGVYSIKASAGSTLTLSYIGFENAEVKIGSMTVVNFSMVPSSTQLQEVVATTFSPTKKALFTGSAAVIKSSDIQARPLTSVLSALSGAASGITTSAGSGQPGASPDIRVRGFGSISASNDPLYVVDGMPYNASIANINPQDIETITVLKDAASTALYGARAANGVVQITTKKGMKNSSNIDVRMSKGTNSRGISEYKRISAPDYYTLMWEGIRNGFAYRASNPLTLANAGTQASTDLVPLVGYNIYNVPNNQLVSNTGEFNPTAVANYSGDDMDWEKPLYQESNREEISLGFSGGSDKTDYLLNFAYLKDKGFLIRSDFERFNLRMNVNSQLKKYLKVGLNLQSAITNSNQSDASNDNNTAFVNPFFFSRGMAPIYPVYAMNTNSATNTSPENRFLLNPDGTYRYDIGNMSALGVPNRPQYGGRHNIYETILNENLFRRNNVGARTFAEFTFLKDFKFTTNVGFDLTNLTSVVYRNPIVGDGAPAGSSNKDYDYISGFNINQLLNYSKTIKGHGIDLLLGHENNAEHDELLTGTRSNQVADGNIELVNFTTTTELRSRARDLRREGYFSRLTYDYRQKYVATLSVRKDASSKFARNVRWGTFYSAGLAWRLDQETFIQNIPAITQLKLKANMGQTGNDGGINRYASQKLYNLNWNNVVESGILQGSLGNDQLTWETSTAYDLGLDFGFLKNRITGVVEYFHRESSDLLFNVPLPISTGVANTTNIAGGASTQTQNIGTMYNEGIELGLSVTPIRTKDFDWNISANGTVIRNKITKMPALSKEIVQFPNKYAEGKSIYDYWLREYKGVRKETGEALYRANTFQAANTFVAENGDTLTTSLSNARFRYTGTSPIPKLNGGFNSTVRFKGFSLQAQFVYQIGGKAYDGAYASLMTSGNHNAKHPDILNRWKNPGDVTNVPRMDNSRLNDFSSASDRWLVDASMLALRNLNFAYNIPNNWASKVGMKNASVYIGGENLFFKTARKGLNVQQQFTGVTSNQYSPNKSVIAGLNFSL
jgi:TonB-linked SusC/RagA family outer membrane protein